METATSSVELSFDDVMYRQMDGVAMGSPLGPALANIFVGFRERKLFQSTTQLRPHAYFRYVDDTFAVFKDEEEIQRFYGDLNSLHPNLQFTIEHEREGKLAFFDVMV